MTNEPRGAGGSQRAQPNNARSRMLPGSADAERDNRVADDKGPSASSKRHAERHSIPKALFEVNR